MSTLREICEQAGFHGQALDTAVAVALAESGGSATAHNGNAGTGDNSYGLFQINMLGSMGPARLHEFGLTSNDQLYDPLTNAKVAYQLSNGGQNFGPWTTYTGGAYKSHLGANATVTNPLGSNDVGSGSVVDPVGGATDAAGSVTDGTGSVTDATGAATGSHYNIDTGSALGAGHTTVIGGQWNQVLGIHAVSTSTGLTGGTGLAGGSGLPGTNTATGQHTDSLKTFIDSAVAQRGDPYVFAAKGAADDPNPKAFDCSGLTKWASDRAGNTDMPDGAAHQYLYLKGKGMLIPVDQAIHTPGALLFHFATEPQPGGEPPEAHVAISLGNGKTIEAANPDDGVDEFNAGGGRFEYAAVIPGVSDASAQQIHAEALGTASASDHLLSSTDSAHAVGSSTDWSSGAGHTDLLGSGLGVDLSHPGSSGLLDLSHEDYGGHGGGLGHI